MVALLGLLDLRALSNAPVVSGKQRREVRTGRAWRGRSIADFLPIRQRRQEIGNRQFGNRISRSLLLPVLTPCLTFWLLDPLWPSRSAKYQLLQPCLGRPPDRLPQAPPVSCPCSRAGWPWCAGLQTSL